MAKVTQKRFYRRIHRLVYADDELTLGPGELPEARQAVLALPWFATIRELTGWIVTNFIYCFAVLRPFALVTHDKVFPVSLGYWFKAFLLLTFPFAPLVMMAALLALSSATLAYVQFFFRRGEYEQHRLAITSSRRGHVYVALVSYTLLVIIFAQNYRFSTEHFDTIKQALEVAQATQFDGLYLLLVVLSLLLLLSRLERRSHTKLPPALEERAVAVAPINKRCPKCGIAVGFGIDVCPQDGTLMSFPGDESASFDTNYEFLEEIARGGMCVIYKARHRLLKKVVAIKMLDSSAVPQFQATERFAHEARASSRLQHPNIVSILDFGQFASQKLYLVMEYLPGKTLGTLIAESHAACLSRIAWSFSIKFATRWSTLTEIRSFIVI